MGDDYRHKKGNSPGLLGGLNSYEFSLKGLLGGGLTAGVEYNYLTGIVKEVISNPEEFLNRLYYDDETGDPVKDDDGNFITIRQALSGKSNVGIVELDNKYFIDHIPLNSTIVHIIDSNNNSSSGKNVLCFPFSPPHLSFPVKPGEYVWLVKEDVKGAPVYYWMCRKVGIRQLDDINLTHFERHDVLIDAKEEYERTSKKVEGDGVNNLANFYTPVATNLEKGDTFDEIAALSIAFKEEFTGEPVPRQAKNCSDLLIQGSNNSHIMLGTEKFMKNLVPDSEFVDPSYHSGKNRLSIAGDRNPISPAIDICIGRKRNDILSLKNHIVSDIPGQKNFTASGNNFDVILGHRDEDTYDMTHMEVDKTIEIQGKQQNLNEFIDAAPTNCLARIYMSNTKTIDTMFGIPGGAEPSDLSGEGDYSNLVCFSSNTRVVGRETVKLYNSSGASSIIMTAAGDIILQNNAGAKIALDASGDIRIVPGSDGKVYIGGEKDQAGIKPLGTGGAQTQVFESAEEMMSEGPVDFTGNIVSSAGGLLVEPAGSGRLASKVRMR